MRTAYLERLESSDEGTFGRFSLDDSVWFSGELPWRDNASNISCLPEGSYKLKATWSPRFNRLMYLVEDTGQRLGIRIHSANFMGDSSLGLKCQLNGCIALGNKLGTLAGQKGLILSKPAVFAFEQLAAGESFLLEIF